MADLTLLKQEFANYADSLKETSRGGKSNNEFLCESGEIIYNFENYVNFREKIEKNPKFKGKRFDALHIQDNNIYCVEFKIEKYSDIKKQDMESKFKDSFAMIQNIFTQLKLQSRDYLFNFFVIFKDIENDRHFGRRKSNDTHFELERRLNELKKDFKFKIENKVGSKSSFLQIYNQIFSTKC